MHLIRYINSPSSWDEALPMGNGHFGAMAYQDNQMLALATNHYDVHYKANGMYSKRAYHAKQSESVTDTSWLEYVKAAAVEAHENPEDPGHTNYNAVLSPKMKEMYGVYRKGHTDPITGEMRLLFREDIANADYSESALAIEKGRHNFSTRGRYAMKAETIILCDTDVLLTHVSGNNLVDCIELVLPVFFGCETKCKYYSIDDHTVCAISEFYPDHEDEEKYRPFQYITILKLYGCKSSSAVAGDIHARIKLEGVDFYALLTVVADLDLTRDVDATEELIQRASLLLDEAWGEKEQLILQHEHKWDAFFSRSSINIPDKMLEKLWYFGLYALECASGLGAKLYQHACGLNGLWDIRQPTQWGSLWYWDVNIEQAFWPIYTSNHLELGKAFYDGLLSYADNARRFALEKYGIKGISSDYPFQFYFCIWAWCANYFWKGYLYSGDIVFLREKAYPLFKEIISFFEAYMLFDEERGEYYIFPDVAPEQGPVTRSSTITVSSVKNLLMASIQAAGILDLDKDEALHWQDILAKMPAYSTGYLNEFGMILKDSEWAETNQLMGHGSMLMPIFPMGEIGMHSEAERVSLANNTLSYAKDNIPICTHTYGWVSAGLAHMGRGAETVDYVYKYGIAHMMRSNGFFSEETERFMQDCLVACEPVYNPPLVEGNSALTTVINEMLLHSYNGIIEVFPAIPRGENTGDGKRKTHDETFLKREKLLDNWQDCSFDKLLAIGSHEISAIMKNDKVVQIEIHSNLGGIVRLLDPFNGNYLLTYNGQPMDSTLTDGIISFESITGGCYRLTTADVSEDIGINGRNTHTHDQDDNGMPQVYQSPSGRRVFLGKNADTDYFRALDSFTHDYYQGDKPNSRVTLYKLDFTNEQSKKNYSKSLRSQIHACGKAGLDVRKVGTRLQFTQKEACGWECIEGLAYRKSGKDDPFTSDFIYALDAHTFKTQLVRGFYEMLFVSGDNHEPTHTRVSINGLELYDSSIMSPGRYVAPKVIFMQPDDGAADIVFDTSEGYSWKVCIVFINRLL